ncbi:MAG: Tad domain-containing protein [Cryobacterium sp.]|nr:Tad domain-containing protein [Cryobacterium sp.]
MVLMAKRAQKNEQGAVAIFVALLTVVMFAFAAMVVDLGNGRTERRQAQSSADASALAGGNALYATATSSPDFSAAEAAAKAYATKNYGVTASEWSACTDPARLGTTISTQCISFEVSASAARVRVKMPERTLPTTFARAIGVNNIKVSALARATIKRGGASDCGLCILGTGTTHDVQNGDVIVNGNNIHFNGNVSVSSNGLVSTTGGITVEGSASGPLSSYSPDPNVGVPPIQDPLADLLTPDMTGLTAKTDPCVQGPGKYGAKNFPNGLCTLLPGTYVVTGLWDFSGNTSLAGTGVTLYFTCGTPTTVRPCASPGEAGGQMDFSGNGDMTIKAPTTGPPQGMAIWYDRLNTSELRLTGNGANIYTGTIYAPSSKYRFNGNGCGYPQNALVIVRTLELNGNNACLRITYSQGLNAPIPPGELHLDQ